MPSIWSTIDDLASCSPPVTKTSDAGPSKGELVIAGSGIASTRQFTLETLDYIQQADMVYYLVLDLATEAFIQAHAKKCENLHQYYGTEKPRLHTYTQMAEVMLNSVRAGDLTVGIMYGHPGVFVNPSHRAINIAKEEGYSAKMLPGVSAEDCLYADLGIDPSTTGCSMFEASLLLLEKDRLDTRNHMIIWQPGAIGKNAMIFDNEHLHKLADYLEPTYGPDFPIIAYMAAMRPLEHAKIDKITIKDLRSPEIVDQIQLNPCTTIYVPPKTLPPLIRDTDTVWGTDFPRFGDEHKGENLTGQVLLPTSAYRISYPEMHVAALYTKHDLRAIDELKTFIPPKSEKPLEASLPLRRAAMKLALLHHRMQRKPKAEVAEMIASEPGLTANEQRTLRNHVDNVEAILNGKVPLDVQLPPVPSVNTFAANNEVADLFEAIIEAEHRYEHDDGLGGGTRLVVLVR